jgi:hypothetical protein
MKIEPSVGDSVSCVLKQVESFCETHSNNGAPKKYVQNIYTHIILQYTSLNGNSSTAYTERDVTYLVENKKHLFLTPGFFKKDGVRWVEISDNEFYKSFE